MYSNFLTITKTLKKGDAQAGINLLRKYPNQLAAIFIHVVPEPLDDDDEGGEFPKLKPSSQLVDGAFYCMNILVFFFYFFFVKIT